MLGFVQKAAVSDGRDFGTDQRDFVATLLAGHWAGLPDLHTSTVAHPSFKKFVLRHVDGTMNQDQAEAIAGNARDHCPAHARKLCDQILGRVSTF
jgi:hypothetical protein